ncbi:MAG TPA: aconitate hydratase AcnA, partial [Burkholderiales bacterium]|nr:aconitate hydratase AcnA [Burkholderiales bacterium]
MNSVGTPGPGWTRLRIGARSVQYCSLAVAHPHASRLPYALKIVLENLLRQQANGDGHEGDIEALRAWPAGAGREIRFRPARVMMDDTAGIPSLGDLAAMRDAAMRLGGDPRRIAPAIPLDFIVDHSVIADHAGGTDALARNMALEMKRNAERFAFLRWADHAFANMRVVPPGGGICHQVNLEYLARVVCMEKDGKREIAYPDSMIGIDSHTPMINGLGVIGWGVSGMEGVAAALGEPVALLIPPVIGCRLAGRLHPGVTATDLVLTLTQTLRRHDVVGRIIEYFGPGLSALTLADRATVANMTPEAGATMSYFPIDAETLRYLRATGRDSDHVALVETYARAQGLWHDPAHVADYSAVIEIDLATIEPSVAGPRQPHERVPLSEAPHAFRAVHPPRVDATAAAGDGAVKDGDIVIAAITSCTNTSNPAGMLGAGIVARNAVARGLKPMPWVKTSLSPGSRVVADYLEKSGLQKSLDALGFHVAGFGCMTCVGFSGPLAAPVSAAIAGHDVAAAAVLSGNRNYEGRVHSQVRASFLASPPLVVAYAIAGSI